MDTPTLEQRVDRLERLLDAAVEYASRTAMGRVILAKLGLRDA